MTHTILTILFGVLLLPALVMVFVPLLPTFWYLIAVVVVFGVIDGFVHLTLGNFAALASIFGVSVLVDWGAGLLGAKFGGAGWKGFLYGGVGALIGFIVFPPLGAFAGLFVGVVMGEILRARTMQAAFHAGAGALIGALTGIIINFLLAVIFIALFVSFALF